MKTTKPDRAEKRTPPIDNAFVAPGCEQFTSVPAVSDFTPSYPGGMDIIPVDMGGMCVEFRIVMRKSGAFIARTNTRLDAEHIVRCIESHPSLVNVAIMSKAYFEQSHPPFNGVADPIWHEAKAALRGKHTNAHDANVSRIARLTHALERTIGAIGAGFSPEQNAHILAQARAALEKE